MGAPVGAEVKSVVGTDIYQAMQRLGPVEGKLGVRVVKHLQNFVNQFIDLFKTGKWTTNSQICIKMDKDIKKMIKLLEKDDKKLAAHPDVKEAEGDLKFREAVGERAEKMLAIMQRLAERQTKVAPSKEFKQLVNDFAEFKKKNEIGIAHDFHILGKGAPNKKGVEISADDKKQFRAARAEARAKLRIEEEPKLKKGFESRRKEAAVKFKDEIAAGVQRGKTLDVMRGEVKRKGEALPQHKAGIALAGLLPKVIEHAYKLGIDKHLSDKENQILQSFTRENFNRMELFGVTDKSHDILKLINKAFYNKGGQVPAELKKEFDAIREHVKQIEKKATLVKPEAGVPRTAERSIEPEVKPARGTIGIQEMGAEERGVRRAAIKARGKLLEAEMKQSPERREQLEAARSLARNIQIVIKDAYEFVHGEEKIPIMAKNLDKKERRDLTDLVKRTDFAELSSAELILVATSMMDLIHKGFRGDIPGEYAEVFENMRENIKRLGG